MKTQLFINSREGRILGELPPEATSLLTPNREPELREWQAIEHIYREGLFTVADHTALFSPMFLTKTGLPYEKVVSFVEDNPGYDVYLFDSGAHYRYYNFNLFEWFENAMPGYSAKFIDCLGQSGETVDFAALGRSLPDNTILSNAWVGNAWFWREIVGEAVRLLETLRARPSVWRYLCEPVIWNGRIYPYLPLILESLVPYWLTTRDGISVKAYSYDRDYVLARCLRPLELPIVSGFYDLVNEWDEAGPWSLDKREFMRDISRAVLRQWRSTNGHLVYPWTNKRIQPAR